MVDHQHCLHLNNPQSCHLPQPVPLPIPPIQLIVPAEQPIPTQPFQPAPRSHLNWSHFKPQFTGKPDEDV